MAYLTSQEEVQRLIDLAANDKSVYLYEKPFELSGSTSKAAVTKMIRPSGTIYYRCIVDELAVVDVVKEDFEGTEMWTDMDNGPTNYSEALGKLIEANLA